MAHVSGGGNGNGDNYGWGENQFGVRDINDYEFTKDGPYPGTFYDYNPGCKRYRIGQKENFSYIWAAEDPSEIRMPKNLWSIILAFLALIASVVLSYGGVHRPHKLNMNYDTKIIIQDDSRIIGKSKYQLEDSMKKFQDLTGITPAVIAVKEGDVENALSAYEQNFRDEKHYLLYYVENGYYDTWEWRAVQGDQADDVLTKEATDRFNKNVQKALESGTSPADAFRDGLDFLAPIAMKKTWNIHWLIICGMGILISLCYIFIGINYRRKARLVRTAVPAPVMDPEDDGIIDDNNPIPGDGAIHMDQNFSYKADHKVEEWKSGFDLDKAMEDMEEDKIRLSPKERNEIYRDRPHSIMDELASDDGGLEYEGDKNPYGARASWGYYDNTDKPDDLDPIDLSDKE